MTRVCVVGAGPAGVAAALAAAERGASVFLFEGGNEIPLPKSAWPSLLGTAGRQQPSHYVRMLAAKGIEVGLNQRVTKIGADLAVVAGGRRSTFDAVVLSTGSTAVPERLEGMRKKGVHVLDSESAYSELGEKIRDYSKAAVCGSGPVAVEVAEKLRSRGVGVSLLARGGLLPSLNVAPRSVLLDALSSWGIGVADLRPEKVVGVDEVEAVISSGEVIPCDSVVIVPRSAPFVPENPAAIGRSGGIVVDEKMRSSRVALFGAGDCSEMPTGSTTVAVMFESAARLMGAVAGTNASGANVSAKVVGSFFKELAGIAIISSGFGLSEATGLGMNVAEASRSWRGELACSLVFDRGSGAIVGAQLAGKGADRFAESLPLLVASRATLEQVAYQETVVSSDISPITETAREGLREL